MDIGIRTLFTFALPDYLPGFLAGLQIPVNQTMITTWIIMAALILLGYVTVRSLQEVPGPLQNIMETVLDGVHWLVESTMGKDKLWFAPYVLALGMFLAVANLTGLIGVRMPTADLNTTFALSLLTFILTQYYSIKSRGGLGFVKRFFEPLPFLFPLNIIGELANPVSLGFRLFGNMLGGLIIMGLVYSFIPILVPVLPHIYFDLFVGLIQTFIFVMLTMTYVTLGME